MSATKESSKAANKKLSLGDYYLIVYNLVLTIGWSAILFVTVKTAITWKAQSDVLVSKNLYTNVETLLLIFQTAALLEVVHAVVGLVRSNPVLVFLQVLSRIMVVWLILFIFATSRNSVGVFVVCMAWSFAEIVRYLYYALNILDQIPYLLTWCRYTFFIVLYPIGVTGEMICMYKALVFLYPLRNRAKYSYYLPNKYNFSFDLYYFIILAMLAYIPVFPQLYMHMFAQRGKLLGGATKSSKTSQKKSN